MTRRFVTNSAILEAMDAVSHHGRVPATLDTLAQHLGVENSPTFVRQARNLATKSGDLRAKDFIEGRRRRY